MLARLATLAAALRGAGEELPPGLERGGDELVGQRPLVHTYNGFALDLVREHSLAVGIDPVLGGEHRVAAAQVRAWLAANMPQAQVVPAASNAAAALDVAEDRVEAGVTTALAAQMYAVPEAATGVADVADARTRFVLCGKPGPAPARTGSDCTAVVIDVPSRPGSLALAMAEFALRGVDLTRIESRPKRTVFGSYVFHFDCVGHIDDPAVGEALRALHRVCDDVRFLGSWPRPGGPGTAPVDPGDSEEWFDGLRRGER